MENIRKIIKEEINNFDWIDNVPDFNQEQLYIMDTSGMNHHQIRNLLDDLEDLGYSNTDGVPIRNIILFLEYENGEFRVDWMPADLSSDTIQYWVKEGYTEITLDIFEDLYHLWKST